MTATRTNANLLYEASLLDDDAYAYGALILARAIAHATTAEIPDIAALFPSLPNIRAKALVAQRIVAAEFGSLLSEILPGRQLAARRIVVTQDAAELAFA
jgi:hypothetical protein